MASATRRSLPKKRAYASSTIERAELRSRAWRRPRACATGNRCDRCRAGTGHGEANRCRHRHPRWCFRTQESSGDAPAHLLDPEAAASSRHPSRGLVGVAINLAYCASEGGVIAYTRALAGTYAPHGIRTNLTCPEPPAGGSYIHVMTCESGSAELLGHQTHIEHPASPHAGRIGLEPCSTGPRRGDPPRLVRAEARVAGCGLGLDGQCRAVVASALGSEKVVGSALSWGFNTRKVPPAAAPPRTVASRVEPDAAAGEKAHGPPADDNCRVECAAGQRTYGDGAHATVVPMAAP